MKIFATLITLLLLAAWVGVGHAQVCQATESWNSVPMNGKTATLSTVTIPPGCYFAYLPNHQHNKTLPRLSMVARLSAPWLSTASSQAAVIYLLATCGNSGAGVPEIPCLFHEIVPAVIGSVAAGYGNIQTPGGMPFTLSSISAVAFLATDGGRSFTALGAPQP